LQRPSGGHERACPKAGSIFQNLVLRQSTDQRSEFRGSCLKPPRRPLLLLGLKLLAFPVLFQPLLMLSALALVATLLFAGFALGTFFGLVLKSLFFPSLPLF